MSVSIRSLVLVLAVVLICAPAATAQVEREGEVAGYLAAEDVPRGTGQLAADHAETGLPSAFRRAGRALVAWGGATEERLRGWGIPPLVALLGLIGVFLIGQGGRWVLLGRRQARSGRSGERRVPRRVSRLRPPKRPACRDAARLQETLRTRKVA